MFLRADQGGWEVSTFYCYARGLRIKSGIIPLLKYTCGEATVCYAGHQEVGRCCTQGTYITYICLCQVWIRLPTLALNPREETSPEVKNRDISVPTKKTFVLQKCFLKKNVTNVLTDPDYAPLQLYLVFGFRHGVVESHAHLLLVLELFYLS